MRFRELTEARPWKAYQGRTHPCIIASPEDLGNGKCIITEAEVHYGAVYTGRTEVFWGYFVRIEAIGEEWLGEDRHSLRQALLQAEAAAHHSGWSVMALGCTQEFRETGLSANSGYGYHPVHPDRHVHMMEPIPRHREID